MEQPNLNFLGKDRERLGEVSRLFNSAEDRAAFLKAVKDAADMKGSDQQKREFVLKTFLSAPKSRQYLKVAMPELYKEGLKAERGEGWKMSMKDIEKATGATEKEILDPEKGWMTGNFKDLKFLMESEGLDYADALKLLRDTQTKKSRKDIYDDNLIARTVFPRISESLRDTGDFSGQDLALDVGENILQAMPLAGLGTKVATQGLRSGLRILPNIEGYLIENAAVPTVMAAADELRKDDPSLLDFGERAATGAAVNAAAGKMLGAGIRSLVPAKYVQKLETWMNSSGDEALKNKLDEINKIIENPRKHTADQVKKAKNELNLLVRQAEFTNKGLLDRSFRNPTGTVTIADYAANNRNAKDVGKLARDVYEGELTANSNQPWAKEVRKTEKRYDPNSVYFTNRETVFPHMFVNQNKVGSQAGLLKTTGRHNLDMPEFNNYNWNDLEHSNLVKNQLDKMFADHHSKTFHYDIDFDKVVDDILKDPKMVSAIIRAYGGVNPREVVSSYVANKLGRSEWLRRQQAMLGRVFGEYFPISKKQKESDEEE